jgi:hypothetical protein
LSREGLSDGSDNEKELDAEAAFLKSGENIKKKKKKRNFKDEDYTSENQYVNRLKSYTFSKDR